MVILQLNIAHFGKLQDKTIALRPGMNVITGDNESGKSTIASFVRDMIYGIEDDSTEYARFLPYGFSGTVFGGSMKVLVDGAFYEVFRNFLAGSEELRVTKQSDGTVVDDPYFWLIKAVSGVSRERYEETGFAAQFSLQQDLRKWNGSAANPRGSEELKIRNQYRKARKVLAEKRTEFENRIDPEAGDSYERVVAEADEKEQRLEIRSEEQKKEAEKLQKMIDDLEKDRKRVEIENKEQYEKLKNRMLDAKKALEPYAGAESRKASKNVLGAVFLTIGIALCALAAYGRFAYQIFSSEHQLYYYMLGALGLGILWFIVGLVLTIIFVAGNNRQKKAKEKLEQLRPKAEAAERTYQHYLDHRDELEQKIDKQAFREESIETLRGRQAILDAEIDKLDKEVRSLRESEAVLLAKCEEQKTIDVEIRALNLAIESLDKLGAEKVNAENEALQNAATNYLGMLSRRKKDRIVISEDNTASVLSENGELALSDLSMSAAQEVILAIRLAGVEETDPNRTLPIILDDVFAGFDTERLNSCLNLLRSLSRQVVLFSSQSRERRLL